MDDEYRILKFNEKIDAGDEYINSRGQWTCIGNKGLQTLVFLDKGRYNGIPIMRRRI